MRYENEVKGKGKQIKGSAKEELGRLTNNPDLNQRGRREKAAGRAQEKLGRTKRKIGEAIEDVGDKIAG
jgi:uncharacterized protein YjbJ (UPF0337 family)